MHIDLTMMYEIMCESVYVDLDCLKLSQCVNTKRNMFKIAKESAKLDRRI